MVGEICPKCGSSRIFPFHNGSDCKGRWCDRAVCGWESLDDCKIVIPTPEMIADLGLNPELVGI